MKMKTNEQKVRPIRPATQADSMLVEQCILGGLILAAWQPPPAADEAWGKVKFLTARDFSESGHGLIFSAIQSLISRGNSFDLISLCDSLEREGNLEKIGGQEYLAILGRDTPSAACIDQHAKILWRKSIERQRLSAISNNDHALAATLTAQLEKQSSPAGELIPVTKLTLEQLITLPPPPKFLIEGYMPHDVWSMVGTGGTGKSTLLLQHCVHIILGIPLWGMEILVPGRVVYITAEDSIDRIRWRLFHIIDQMGLPGPARQKLADDLHIVNLVGTGRRLAALDGKGNITSTSLSDQIIDAFTPVSPAMITFDPLVKFGPGERMINDGEDAVVNVMMHIMHGLHASVGCVHHVSKFVARNGIIDHHAGRGGSALGDGVRAVYQLERVCQSNCANYRGSEIFTEEMAGNRLLGYSVTKLTDAPRPDAAMLLRRDGWLFTRLETQENSISQLQGHVERIAEYLHVNRGKFLSRRALEDLHADIGIGRNAMRSAVQKGLVEGIFSEAELPDGKRHGRRKTFIFLSEA